MINSWRDGTKQCVILADPVLLVLRGTISEAASTCLNEVSPAAASRGGGNGGRWGRGCRGGGAAGRRGCRGEGLQANKTMNVISNPRRKDEGPSVGPLVKHCEQKVSEQRSDSWC